MVDALIADSGDERAVDFLSRGADGLQAPEHRSQPQQADALSVQLPHLAQRVRLLYPFDDPAVCDTRVIKEIGLKRTLRGRCSVQSAGGRSPDCPVGQYDVAVAKDVGQFDPEIGQALPDFLDRVLGLVPVHEPAREPDAVLPIPSRIDEAIGSLEILVVHGLDEAAVDVSGRVHVSRLLAHGTSACVAERYYPDADYLSTDELGVHGWSVSASCREVARRSCCDREISPGDRCFDWHRGGMRAALGPARPSGVRRSAPRR